MRTFTTRAAQIAALPDLGLAKLPATFTKTLATYQAAMELHAPPPPHPATRNRQIIADVAIDAVAGAVLAGRAPVVDIRPIAATRAADQEAADRAALVAEIGAAAAVAMADAATTHRDALIAALKARHAEVAAALIAAAAVVPPGADEVTALRASREARDAYLAAEQLAGQIEALRVAMVEVDADTTRQVPDRMEQALTYVRTPMVYDKMTTWGETPWGDLGTAGFLISLAHDATDVATWWLPTWQECSARAREIFEERRKANLMANLTGVPTL